ncbi:MAG TPA: acyl-CoA dehydrogenase family protein [Aliidongia sp.]|uniref:acyl-CoA dehydrogenase family protein n=1 Tax=Aliidongia sp. TaxID=1914230 RepID=UPI002DDD7844|nr:acyl-CoA dehydrogenase family protein [Aliidongia sp.]HEV2676091.1 acyl-CoA dehydrogenase family protein [Aliidongia sp.]
MRALRVDPTESADPLPDVRAIARDAADACRAEAAALDRSGLVPPSSIRRLGEAGLLAAPLGLDAGGWGLGGTPGSTARLLEILTIIGGGDLAIGRLYEGHVNALLLVDRFGTPTQRQRVAMAVRHHHALLGVWNTDTAAPLTLVRAGSAWHLAGGKSFASGVGLVAHALVTARRPDGGRQMLLVPMADLACRIDRTSWQPLGMRASMSFHIDLEGVGVGADAFLGQANDYLAEPWFSAGCIRFLAVQLGGALALLRTVHAHLRRTGREGDPYQIERFARMRVAVETGRLWLDRAAAVFDGTDAPAEIIATANMARHAIEQASTLTLELAGRSVGVQGMLAPHPMERLIRDLSTYMRQPAPDAALASVGRAALAADELPW